MNKYICTGNLTKDVELKYLSTGTQLAKFDIAVNTKFGEKTETVFWKCNIFGKMAEVANQYLHKGSKVLIEARVTENNWTGKDGKMNYSKELVIEKLEFIGCKSNNTQTNQAQNTGNYAPNTRTQSNNTTPSIDIDEQDIPF